MDPVDGLDVHTLPAAATADPDSEGLEAGEEDRAEQRAPGAAAAEMPCEGTKETGVMNEVSQHLRMLEALLFAASEPLDAASLAERLPEGADVPALLKDLQDAYADRGVVLVSVGGRWALRTAPDLSFLMERERVEPRRLSKAGIETLAIIAYHQPVTRAEIEEIRGVAVSKGTIDLLMEIGWVRLRGRRRTPGRPVTYGTTEAFLDHFGLESIEDLPGMEELKAAGLLDGRLPPDFTVPSPRPAAADETASLDEEDEETVEFQTDFLDGAEAEEGGEASSPSSQTGAVPDPE